MYKGAGEGGNGCHRPEHNASDMPGSRVPEGYEQSIKNVMKECDMILYRHIPKTTEAAFKIKEYRRARLKSRECN